jgi:hypothetical protein
MRRLIPVVALSALVLGTATPASAADPIDYVLRLVGIGHGPGIHAYNCCKPGQGGCQGCPSCGVSPGCAPMPGYYMYMAPGTAPAGQPLIEAPLPPSARRHPLNLSAHDWSQAAPTGQQPMYRLPPVADSRRP